MYRNSLIPRGHTHTDVHARDGYCTLGECQGMIEGEATRIAVKYLRNSDEHVTYDRWSISVDPRDAANRAAETTKRIQELNSPPLQRVSVTILGNAILYTYEIKKENHPLPKFYWYLPAAVLFVILLLRVVRCLP